ncbi:MAG: hypothetical protein AAGA46_12410 [Cyanobacteria bacterium P01_F01_bin.13]
MLNPASSDDNLPEQRNTLQDVLSQGAELPIKQSDNNSWQAVHFPGAISANQILGSDPHLPTNAMDSSSTHQNNSTSSIETPAAEQTSQREAELLNLVRDLNECNDVLLAKVSQLEESLERSQAALQAEIDRSGPPVGDREIVQLVTELEQSNQALQHHQRQNETLQTELTVFRERATQLETEHAILLQQHSAQSQELLQANTNCRDLRARLQRQQRYTLQFKAALEKCLSMSTESSNSSTSSPDVLGITMPKIDEIRPWESTLGHNRLDPQLESMIRGLQGNPEPTSATSLATPLETKAEDQLWHDLARVMDPTDVPPGSEFQPELQDISSQETLTPDHSSPQVTEPSPFTEPSPWSNEPSPAVSASLDAASVNADDDLETGSQLSPHASAILARIQAAGTGTVADTYLPAMSAQGSPSPLVNPLKPQKRIGSLSAIDLPNFPRLKKQPPQAKA